MSEDITIRLLHEKVAYETDLAEIAIAIADRMPLDADPSAFFYDSVPDGTPVGGAVWTEMWLWFRARLSQLEEHRA